MTTSRTKLAEPGGAVPRRAGPIADLLDLLLPTTCAGCQSPGLVLCADCAAGWFPAPRRCEHDAGRLDRLDGRGPVPVWAQGVYQGAVRRTVLAWKDHGRLELTRWFAAYAAAAARTVIDHLAAGECGDLVLPACERRVGCTTRHPAPARSASTGPLLVIPAPASAAGRRRRGEDLLRPLAVAVASASTAAGISAIAMPCLRVRRAHRDQVGLGRRARGANMAGRIAIRAHPALFDHSHPVLLIDDVLTTGATLAACRDRVEASGQHVIGAWVLAATPSPTHRTEAVESRTQAG